MRIQSLIAGAAASLIAVALGAIASIASHLSASKPNRAYAGTAPVAMAAKRLDYGCAECGVVLAVRPIELKNPPAVRYQIQLRMSDGSVKTLTSSTPPEWKAGDRVRLLNGRLAG
jgi:hypothetical protein